MVPELVRKVLSEDLGLERRVRRGKMNPFLSSGAVQVIEGRAVKKE